jgi:Ca-activated chloride channel family protein
VEWRDLWERKDQQGSESFTQDNFTQAAEEFKDPAWRAAANYRNESYEQVVQDLALLTDPESHYNRGNALARLNQFPEAIAAYEQTLAQVPDHADALHNKAIVEELLKQQEEQEQQQQEQEGDQQDQEQQDGDQQQEEQNQDQEQQSDQQQQQESEEQGEQSDQEQQNQDQQESEQENEGEQEDQQEEPQPSDSEQPDSEEEQAMQQWLRRIPDDPGELLRNKFKYQAQQRVFQQLQNPALAEQQAAEQIW